MSERDEMAEAIAAAMDDIRGFIAWTDRAPVDLADAMLAAGFRKPTP
jgi:hypothetical protein